MKFLFIAKGDDDAATRYRVLPVVEALAERGHDTEIVFSDVGLLGKAGLLRKAAASDLVFVQRKLFSGLFAGWLRRASSRLVFDFDDAVFLRSNGEPSPSRGRRFERVCQHADLVVAGNQYLLDEASNLSDNVIVVPTPVDAGRYRAGVDKDEDFTMVWIGSSSTRKYLENNRHTLEVLGEAIDGLVLKVIADFEFQLDNMEVINVPWSSETEAAQLASSHVGIAPMEDNPWTRGKCALKVIQYMAARLPVVSSPVGANRDVIVDGETGMLADTAEEWIAALRQLRDSPGQVTQMGDAGYRRFEQSYSLDAVRGLLLAALEGLSS